MTTGSASPRGTCTPDAFRRAPGVPYLGAVGGRRAALDRMPLRDRGTIVHVGSALAYRGIPLQAPYCGAKHAIQGFFESRPDEAACTKARTST